MSLFDAAQKFDPARACEYQAQSRIALAGYDACHELAACMLAAVVRPGIAARILVVGAGGGAQEIVTAGKLNHVQFENRGPVLLPPRRGQVTRSALWFSNWTGFRKQVYTAATWTASIAGAYPLQLSDKEKAS